MNPLETLEIRLLEVQEALLVSAVIDIMDIKQCGEEQAVQKVLHIRNLLVNTKKANRQVVKIA